MPSGITSVRSFHFFPVWQTSDYNSPCCEYVKFGCKIVEYIYQYEAITHFGEKHTSKTKTNSDLHCDSFVLPCLLGTQSGYADNRFVCILKTSGRNKCFYDSLFGHKKQKVIGKWGKNKTCSSILCIFANSEIKRGGVGETKSNRNAEEMQHNIFTRNPGGYKTTWNACASRSSTGSPASYSGNTEFKAQLS